MVVYPLDYCLDLVACSCLCVILLRYVVVISGRSYNLVDFGFSHVVTGSDDQVYLTIYLSISIVLQVALQQNSCLRHGAQVLELVL